MRLLAALEPRPPFQVLVVSERKTIGRETYETGYRIKQLDQAGVDIVEYVHGRSLTPKNWIEKVTSYAEGWGDEQHRQKSSERTHASHTALARAGRVAGGRVFGYRNADVIKGEDEHGRPLRSHVEREVVPQEAAVVRHIFELYDSGLGLKAVAKRLNAEGAPCPKPFKRKGWIYSDREVGTLHDPRRLEAGAVPRCGCVEQDTEKGRVGQAQPAAAPRGGVGT